jgi:hypothetical protein
VEKEYALFLIQNESFKSSSLRTTYGVNEMNVVVKGVQKQVLDAMIEKGYASTQSEAIRLALFWFGQSKLNLDELAVKKMEKLHKEIKSSKRKVYSLDEMIKMHPEYKTLK